MSVTFEPIPTIDLTPYTPARITEAGPLKRLVVASICAGSALMPAPAARAHTAGPETTIPQTTISLPAQDLDICPPVTQEAFQAVDRLLAQHTEQVQYVEDPINLRVDTESTPQQRSHEQWTVKAELAAQTDQTLYDPTVYTDRLAEPLADPSMPPLPFSAYTSAVQEFGQKYGIAIRLAGAGDTSLVHEGFYPHSSGHEGNDVREGIIDTIKHLGGLTKEYVDLTGVKQIVLYDGYTARRPGFAVYGRNEVALPIGTRSISEYAFTHEFGHFHALVTCGGAHKDPQFDAPGREQFSSTDSRLASQELVERRTEALDKGDYGEACRITEELGTIEQQIGAFTIYGKTNRGENKADMISMLGSQTLYQDAIRPGAPEALKQRTRIMLGRLYMTSENIATYFIRLMPRKVRVSYIAQACQTGDFSELERRHG